MTKENDPKSVTSKKQSVQYIPVQYLDSPDKNDEIDLMELINTVWTKRKTILKFTIVFLLIGLFHFLAGPEEYQSEAILLQENQQGHAQNLRLLQSSSGINFGGMNESETLSVTLYPRIVESVEFQHRLLQHEVPFETLGETITLYRYFNEYYTPPFRDRFYATIRNYTIRLPITLFRNVQNLFTGSTPDTEFDYTLGERSDIINLNSGVRRAIGEMRGRILVEFEGSLITVKTQLPDPIAAAEVNLLLVNLIQEYVITYRSEKARQNLEFVQSMYDDAMSRYEEAQFALASFSDANRGQLTATARIEEERLIDEKNLTFSIYNSIAQRLEDSRLRLQEETPVFSRLQNPNIPNSAIGTSFIFVIASGMFGFFIGVGWVFVVKMVNNIKMNLSRD